jgi:hypothetical protein
MRRSLVIMYMTLHPIPPNFLIYEEILFSFLSVWQDAGLGQTSSLRAQGTWHFDVWVSPCLEYIVDFFESQKLDGVYRPVHVVPVVGEILLFLKGPKHENLGSRFLTSSKPILVGDLRTWRRNELYSRIGCIFGENCIRRMMSMRLMF